VSSTILEPEQALAWLEEMLEAHPEIRVVGIAGPGDPFANPEETMTTLRLVRKRHPRMLLCVATNGLALQPHIEELAALDVSHVTLTINAVDPDISSKMYRWMRDGTRVLRGSTAAERLLERQLTAIPLLKGHGIIVKVNSIVVPGINTNHIPAVAGHVAQLGADILNALPLYPVEGSEFAHVDEPSRGTMESIRREASAFLPMMRHCTRCRADAVGLLGRELTRQDHASLHRLSQPKGDAKRPYIAVASQEGWLVNEHLGNAREFLIYTMGENGPERIDRRNAPGPGGGDRRWEELGKRLDDCHAVLVSFCGQRPRSVLSRMGVQVHIGTGLIQLALESLFTKGHMPTHMAAAAPSKCGTGCGGSGGGCAV
jgi:nitrogen fixation protein NifB